MGKEDREENKIAFKTAAGLALASVLSAAPAKADMFDNVRDYAQGNNTAYVEIHTEEAPQEAYQRILEPTESILEPPSYANRDLMAVFYKEG